MNELSDFASLLYRVQTCQDCGLFRYSNYFAIAGKGELSRDTDLFLIGEAPGWNEMLKGEVFIGPAGKLLDRMLKPYTEGLNVYITNAVKCYPPADRNDPSKGFRVPKKTEIDYCYTHLLEELDQISSDTVLMPLGGTALYALTGEEKGITKALGKPFKLDITDTMTCTVVPNYHPSYILRNMNRKSIFEDVVKAAVKIIKGD